MQAAAAVVFSVKPRFSSASPSVPRLRSHRGPPVAASAALGTTTTTTESMAAKWAQKTVVIPPQRRGCHLITSKVRNPFLVLSRFLQMARGDSAVLQGKQGKQPSRSVLMFIVCDQGITPTRPDDMPAHIKSSMFGCALTIPITDGRLNMGTWQGIWLCEHRDHATPRKIVITLNGM
ncbi:hypothetical protein C4D60_Mb06t04610 [Musa balbisiana]|uniref:Secondary thiamine-phosphate synthase enzyme n=1 Tax=Musa balbisiana TaxID=52838 RepID=A0A4S8ILB3_MUSBA|nr:hypothetical protein C4D60_Mb06t04610 [Musa balbisiana]